MKIVLILLAALVAAPLLFYLLAPRALFQWARKAQRGKGGLVQKSVRVGDMTWPYLEGGNPAGKALVLVHGFGGDKDNWSFYAPYVKQDYRLIFPDLPGFGENDRSMTPDHSIAVQAERLRDFLTALGIGTCHLGGNSMGGAIALRFALDFPERLHSLTLFNNAGVIGTEESELQQLVEQGESPLVPRTMADIDRLLAFVVYKPRWVPHQFKRVMFGEMKRHEALLDKIFNQIAADALEKPLNDRLGEIELPTQIIWGRHDRLLDVTCAVVQHQGIPHSELVIFEDVGHVPMIEKPRETARHHLAFLAKH
jgi:pimeloyl-ACP methyl ester carboxylesterase